MNAIYRLTITTLSPLHIGTGQILRQGYDYTVQRGKTWVIDTDALAREMWQKGRTAFDNMARGVPAEQLLTPADYTPESKLFRYVLPGTPRSTRAGSEIQEQIKDVWERPYIPGSSLKGALRTALFAAAVEKFSIPVQVRELKESARFAAQPLEQRVFSPRAPKGKFPNYDLLRALQVGDSEPDEKRRLELLNVQVVSGRKLASPIELEAIPRGINFTATLTLDGFLLQKEVVEHFGWLGKMDRWLFNLPKVVNYVAGGVLANQSDYWRNSSTPIRSFFVELNKIIHQMDPKHEFIMQLGWGGGWDSKTLGPLLTEDPRLFAQVVRRYQKQMLRKGSYHPGDRYPKSRRVVVRGDRPIMPLGWVKVRMERVQ